MSYSAENTENHVALLEILQVFFTLYFPVL